MYASAESVGAAAHAGLGILNLPGVRGIGRR